MVHHGQWTWLIGLSFLASIASVLVTHMPVDLADSMLYFSVAMIKTLTKAIYRRKSLFTLNISEGLESVVAGRHGTGSGQSREQEAECSHLPAGT